MKKVMNESQIRMVVESIVKNLKGNIGFGFDSDMSYYFNDKVDFNTISS